MHRPLPNDWKKTTADLLQEEQAQRRAIYSPEEWEWARAYDRAALRKWARFPRDGEVFEAVMDVEVFYLSHWSAPVTGGGKVSLRQGTRGTVRVEGGDPEPLVVTLDVSEVDQDVISQVPTSLREHSSFRGITVQVFVADLNREWRLVS